MKKLTTTLLAIAATISLTAQTPPDHPFQNPNLSTDKRIDNLVELLTPQEKIGLMMNSSKAVERLGIPAYDWWNEALHGVARAGRATVFPQAIGMAATWNEPLHQQTFEMISDEARAKYNRAVSEGNRGRYYGLSFWTPNINIFRDPRWGRGQETYGEDPFLTSRLGVAAVLGLQGNDPKYFKTHACAKHYAVHSGPEWSRHSYNATPTGRDLWETYLPAFKALVQEANVQEVMCAYNALDGVPCCGSDQLLVDILRNRWGYDGLVVSDCAAINDFYLPKNHGTHPNPEAASADAVIKGTDIECGSVYENLTKALADGLITEQQIDVSLRRILRGWFNLGMFDPAEMVPWNSIPYSVVDSPQHREQALRVARESMVLLKNNGVLPLSRSVKKIAVIGANAADSTMLWGNYNGMPSSTVTILDGIRAKLPNAEIIYERGCDLADPWVRSSLFDNVKTSPNGAKGMKAEFFNNNTLSGTPVATAVNNTVISYNNSGGTALAPGVAMENTSTRVSGYFVAPYTGEVVISARTSDGYKLFVDNKVVLQQSGREAAVSSEYKLAAIKGKSYKIVLEHSQTGRRVNIELSVFKKSAADFSQLVAKIKDVDAIIYVGGLSPRLEGEEMPVSAEGFRGGDRVSIGLPDIQSRMLAELRKTGKPVVFVLCTGSAIALERDELNYDALLCAWYGGQSAGRAVADVLVGDYNPAGRLPVTFYRSLEQLDAALVNNANPAQKDFENYDMAGRTYRYMTSEPLYRFGDGLSYSQFEYGSAQILSPNHKAGEPAAANYLLQFKATNVSTKDGEEVVQVYVKRPNDPDAPQQSLRAFKRVHVPAGESVEVTLQIDPESFQFYDKAADGLVHKSGEYHILYGGSSNPAKLKNITINVQ